MVDASYIVTLSGAAVPDADVLSISISRNVAWLFNRLQQGTASIVVDNSRGDWSPDNKSGPNSLFPMQTLAVKAISSAQVSNVTTVADASPTGNTGTLSGCGWISGYLGFSALWFPGSNNNLVTLDTQPSISSGFTFEAWVLWDGGLSGSNAEIFNNNQFFMRRQGAGDNDIEAFVRIDGGITPRAGSTITLTQSEWTHVAATWDTNELALYINGILRDTQTRSGTMPNSTAAAQIGLGEQGDTTINPWSGAIDSVRFWDSARTQQQIQDNKDRELKGDESGLIGNWKLNDAEADATGLFSGFVDSFGTASVLGQRRTQIDCIDVANLLQRTINSSLQVDTQAGSLAALIASQTGLPSGTFSQDTITDGVPFAFLDDISAGEAFNRIVKAGAHFLFIDGDGTLKLTGRDVDSASPTIVASFQNEGIKLDYLLPIDRVINDVRVRGQTRKAFAVTSVAQLADQPAVAASRAITFRLNYQDPDNQESPLPVQSLVTPVSSTDWQLNTQADGGGTDKTSAGSLSLVELFATSAKFEITNTDSAQVFVNKFFVRGGPLRREPVFAGTDVNSDSQVKFQRRTFELESDLVDDFNFTQNYAEFLEATYSDPTAVIDFSLRNQIPEQLDMELIDVIHIVDSITGVASNFRIFGLEHAIAFDSVGTAHTTQYQLLHHRPAGSFQLDIGQLDIDTLGF